MHLRPPKPPQSTNRRSPSPTPKASDALPLPLYLTNGIFFTLFFSVAYFLLHRWRDKIRSSTPLHVITVTELVAIALLIASFIYLLGFFGITFVQSFISKFDDVTFSDDDVIASPKPNPKLVTDHKLDPKVSDEEIVKCVVDGSISSYSLEERLGDCRRAAAIRREAVERKCGKKVLGLGFEGFDYEAILGQCCEMPIGYVQVPVGVVGPLLFNGGEFMVPMATTEGCLVAVLLKDGMSRAPVVRFGSVARAACLKFFLEDPINFDTLSIVFNKNHFHLLLFVAMYGRTPKHSCCF